MTFNTISNSEARMTIISFKPCYKWMTFNTMMDTMLNHFCFQVLNLVINGWPSILNLNQIVQALFTSGVLNLVINGWPSIQ